MTSRKVKRILLAVLLVVAGYIWWGNLQLFFRNQSPVYQTSNPPPPAVKVKSSVLGVKYRSPKTNPFLRPSARGNTMTATSKPPPQAPRPLKPHERYNLSGILKRGKVSQAILRSGQSESEVLSLGDSLDNWQLIKVEEYYSVFRQGKNHDTVWLVPKNK